MRGDATREERRGEKRERMSDVLIKFLLFQPAKHFPQLITGKSEVIIISRDFTSSQIIKQCCPLTPFCRGQPA